MFFGDSQAPFLGWSGNYFGISRIIYGVLARSTALRYVALAITTVNIYILKIYLSTLFIPINLYISGYTQSFTTLVNIATGAGKSAV